MKKTSWLVILTFFFAITMVSYADAQEHTYSNSADWDSLEPAAIGLAVVVLIGVVIGVVWLVSKATKKKTNTEKPVVTPKEEKPSPASGAEGASMSRPEEMQGSGFAMQKVSREGEVVVLSW